jgi:geranylgeranyl pyrophosphate synthase
MDDCLDFTSSSDEFGKPSNGFDLELGLATAPVLFAYQSHPSLKPLIERRFKGFSENGERDSQVALELVRNSDAIEKTKDLARWYSGQAIKALEIFPSNTESKAALLGLAEKVVTRNK